MNRIFIFEVMKCKYLFIIFFAITSIAQQPSHYVVGEEELAGISIYSLIQDEDKSVWISTNNGLYNYDGTKFLRIETHLINDLSLFGLTKDKFGDIYFFNLSGQIFKIQDKKIKLFWQVPKKYNSSVFYILFDRENNLIVSCKSLLKVNKNGDYKVCYDFSRDACHMTQDRKNTIFFWDKNKLYKFDGKRLSFTVQPKTTENIFLAHQSENNVVSLVSNLDPIVVYKSFKGDFKQVNFKVPLDSNISYITYISQKYNYHWIASSNNGIYCFNKDGSPNYNGKKLFQDYFISSYLEDNEGNIWLATFGKGILIIPNMKIIDFSNNSVIGNDDLSKITKKNKTIYFGGVKGNIYELKNNDISIVNSDLKKIETLHYISKNDVFFVNSSVFKESFTNKKIAENTYNKYDIYESEISDSVFFVTRSGLFNLDKNFEALPLQYDIRSYCVYKDEKNNITWIGSSTGLEIKKGNKITKVEVLNQPIFANKIIGVNNETWVASNSGICVFEKDKFSRKINKNEGLISDKINKLIKQNNYVYISSNEGIQRYDLLKNTFVNFTKSNGLISNAVFDFEVEDEQIYIITAKGIQKFNFNDLQLPILPKIYFESTIVNGAEQVKTQAVLPNENNTIEFHLKTIIHGNKSNLKYVYKLKGYDQKWYENSFLENTIKYTNLPAGKYEFEVFLKDANGSVSKSSVFSFEIEEVFWKKTKNIILFSLLLLALIYMVYRIRIHYLLNQKNSELEKERYKIELAKSQLKALNSQMNPHFIFNALNSIQEYILLNKKEQASNYLGDFADLMRSYLEHSQLDSISLKDEIDTLKLYLSLEKIRFEDDLNYKFIIDKNIPLENTEIPSFIIQPFIENAIKHGLLHKEGDKKIEISFELVGEDIIKCEVVDNGVGRVKSAAINKNKKRTSFAVDANQNRLELLNQKFNNKIGLEIIDLYENNSAKGTKVILTLPIFK